MKALILLPFAAALSASTIYSITDLGGLGGASAVGYKINGSGAVIGWAQTTSGAEHGFLSMNGGALQDLSPLLNLDTYANGINASGAIAGTSYVNGQPHGTLWTGSATTDLGAGIFATGINDAGFVIGGNGHAFLLVNGSYQDLGALPGGGWSSASGINNAGTVVGDASTPGGTFRGFIWTPGQGMTALGTLGGDNSHATGINNNGAVIGFASVASGYEHAFVDIGGVMIDLGTLGGGSSFAYGINDGGSVVGYSWLASGQNPHAFLYANGILLDLNSLIPSGSGWELTGAYGINSAGQIVGEGLFHGESRAFLLDPLIGGTAAPEASTAALVAIGLAFVLFAMKRSRAQGGTGFSLCFGASRGLLPRADNRHQCERSSRGRIHWPLRNL